MDFVTHSLVGAGIARLAARERSHLPQLTLAALLGSLLVDGDSWLYLLGPNMYGKYHRVLTHSLLGLGFHAMLSAGMAALVFTVRPTWRRFGWFAAPNIGVQEEVPGRVTFGVLLPVASLAVVAHFLGDLITGFGNMIPFWPWNPWDASLGLTNSFDLVIFSATIAATLFYRHRQWSTRVERVAALAWLGVVLGYLALRWWLLSTGRVPTPVW